MVFTTKSRFVGQSHNFAVPFQKAVQHVIQIAALWKVKVKLLMQWGVNIIPFGIYFSRIATIIKKIENFSLNFLCVTRTNSISKSSNLMAVLCFRDSNSEIVLSWCNILYCCPLSPWFLCGWRRTVGYQICS